MKLLVLLLVLFFALWLWRRGRSEASKPKSQQPPSAPQIPQMVQCLHCQVHLPLEEAVQGALGSYCSAAHCSAAGDRLPSP